MIKMFRCNEYKMVVPNCWRVAYNPSIIMEPIAYPAVRFKGTGTRF